MVLTPLYIKSSFLIKIEKDKSKLKKYNSFQAFPYSPVPLFPYFKSSTKRYTSIYLLYKGTGATRMTPPPLPERLSSRQSATTPFLVR
jgi:hypothetical protein